MKKKENRKAARNGTHRIICDNNKRNSQLSDLSRFFAGGSMFRLKGSILSMSFLDCNGALIPYSYEPWKDDNRSSDASRRDRKY